MSKERLEELKVKYSKAKIIEHINGIDIIAVDVEDIDELIKVSVDKSERVQGLIKAHELKDLENKGLVEQLKILQSDFLEIKRVAEMHRSNELKLEQQNKRYREAIDYVMEAETSHYSNMHELLDDIKFVINETLEESE